MRFVRQRELLASPWRPQLETGLESLGPLNDGAQFGHFSIQSNFQLGKPDKSSEIVA